MKKIFLLLSALVFIQITLIAQVSESEGTIARLRAELPQSKSAKDSIRLLYDIFDLAERKDLKSISRELYGTAARAGDISTQLDICRQVTAVIRDDKQLAEIEQVAGTLPASDEQKETLLFLKMKRVSLKSRNLSEAERQKEITSIIANYGNGSKNQDKYLDVLNLFTLVEYLRYGASGDMLKTYLDKLLDKLSRSNLGLYAIPNIVYAEAANIYSDAGDQTKALEADRKLLEVINGLEKKYSEMNREYRNYDVSRYVSLRRMLRNYEGLSLPEAEQIYAQCLKLAQSNPDVKKDFDTNPRIHAYINMAKSDYTAAIPYLKKLLDTDPPLGLKRQTLAMLAEAAENSGDNDTKIHALTQYKNILEELNELQASGKYMELQIKYDLKDLKERNSELELENRNDEIESTRKIITFLLVMFILMAAVLIFSMHNWARFKRNAKNMGDIVDAMADERNNIRRRIYYDYADKADIEQQRAISPDGNWRERFEKSGRKNHEVSWFMTESIINDLAYISMVGRTDRRKHVCEMSVNDIMRDATGKAMMMSGNDKRLHVTEITDNYTILTDTECLTDYLADIIEVGLKLIGPDNHISFTCEKETAGRARFIVEADTADLRLGDIPGLIRPLVTIEELEEKEKDGLYICRMIALLITCDLKRDRNTANTTRYIFSIPTNLGCPDPSVKKES